MNDPRNARRIVLSVSELNACSKELLESALPSVWVEGEISNFSSPSSGHWYFSLKDSGAQIRCAMFRGRNLRAGLRPGNGERVLVRGGVSLYAPRGDYQLIVDELQPAGLGALQRALEALRKQLAAEGLFASARKRSLPAPARHVGIVTSATGAALQDVLTVLRRRCPALPVTVFPVPVQGDGAAAQIAAAIATANRLAARAVPPLDVLIVGRGGGSLEDLWAFNEEVVVRAIHASALPVVAAVGHETDTTLADLVADVRAPTPSAAAELVSPDREALLRQLARHELRLAQAMRRLLAARAQQLGWLARRLRHPGARLRDQSQRLDEFEQRLGAALRARLAQQRARLDQVQRTLARLDPARTLAGRELHIAGLRRRLDVAVRQALRERGAKLAGVAQLLDSVSPLATLQRGYAVITTIDGHVLRDAATVKSGTPVRARLARGHLDCLVTGTSATP